MPTTIKPAITPKMRARTLKALQAGQRIEQYGEKTIGYNDAGKWVALTTEAIDYLEGEGWIEAVPTPDDKRRAKGYATWEMSVWTPRAED